MAMSFPAGASKNSLRWAILLALIIDSPFVAVFVLAGQAPVMLLVAILPLGISALIIYSSYAAGRMEYVIGDREVLVRFPLAPLRVGYSRIKGAGKVDTVLNLRLFGGSLPGSHWGTFTTSNLGTVQVYSTRYKGQFVLLELVDGGKILISPLDPDAFLRALNDKTSFSTPSPSVAVELRTDRRTTLLQVAVVTVAWIGLAAYVAVIYPGLPEIIPVHFGLNGVPNRYGSKTEVLVLLAVSAIFPTLNAVFTLKFGKYNMVLMAFIGAVFVLAIGLFGLVVNQILAAI